MTARFKPEEGHGRFVAKNLCQGIKTENDILG